METTFKLLLVAALMIFFSSCLGNGSNVIVDQELVQRLEQLTEKVRNDTTPIIVRLDTLTDYQWDTLLILTPYTYIEEIEQHTKLDLEPIKNTKIVSDEVSNVLAFIKDGQLISYVDLPRPKGDFNMYEDNSDEPLVSENPTVWIFR